MERMHELMLEVWREACRHIEIQESTARIAALVGRSLALQLLLVRRVDVEQACLRTVAVGPSADCASAIEGRTPVAAAELEWLGGMGEGGGGRLAHWPAGGGGEGRDRSDRRDRRDRLLGGGRPGIGDCAVLAGPLGRGGSPSGVLVIALRPGVPLEPGHRALIEALLEPFSVALDNDQRLRELSSLREAAEADRAALLRRLGRQQLVDEVIGADRGLAQVLERVELVARSDAPVLLIGETGTGKELISRLIHQASPRAAGPVLRVNCGAIPPELIDSQLFGHERGAFTGAAEQRRGWFERADGGTLFLDEIGDLPAAAQVRLLRVLQDGTFERVGGQQPVHVDVRVIAATHRDLPSMVSEGSFRSDLWYRIAVFPILLPPLRDRREDIPALAIHFAQRAATRFGLAPVMPTPEELELLAGYAWPGNIRELASVIDRAAILGDGRKLEIAKALGAGADLPRPRAEVGPERAPAAFLTLDAAMRQHIEAALARTGGRVDGPRGAAALLRIHPNTLRARMRKLAIDWRGYRR